MDQHQERYVYRIDANDVIQFVNPEWLSFAQANEAPQLDAAAVIGRPLWDFIVGAETRTLYEALFRGLRARRSEVEIPFRCDSPSVVRHMTLAVRPLVSSEIELEGRVLRIESREPVELLSRGAARSDESIPICSICRRLFVHGVWVEAGAAIVRRDLFGARPIPRLDERVCDTCARELA